MATQKFRGTKQQTTVAHAANIPFLPGNNFHDDPIVRQNLKKSQYLTVVNGANMVTTSVPNGYQPPIYKKIETAKSEAASTHVPPWLSEDKVLRFRAYYKEAISESPIENVRVHRCIVVFHTEDKTVLVREIPTSNSGLTHKVLLKRHRIPTKDDGFLDLDDFNVGAQVHMYGKVFQIISCEDETRSYLESLGKSVPGNEEFPSDDQFAQRQQIRNRTELKARKELGTTDMEMKRHHEYGATGRVSKPTQAEVTDAQRFFQSDGQYLTFAVVWDDRNNPHGDLRKLRLNYYLADDTIELIEPYVNNCGREMSTRVLVRQKVQRFPTSPNGKPTSLLDTLKSDATQHNTFGVKLTSGFMSADELAIGNTISIHGKEYYLYDCNAATRRYYKDNLGIDLAPQVDITRRFNIRQAEPPKPVPPPHDGIGDEEDSLGNWKNLVLKPPKRDWKKWTDNSGKKLQFVLRMVPTPNATYEEEGRHFLLSFWLEDDTLQIDEVGIPNSGLLAGKYLSRQKVKRTLPDGRKLQYKAEDFAVGATVELWGRWFEVIDQDYRTMKIIEGVEEAIPLEQLKQLIVQLRDGLALKYGKVTEAFRAVSIQCNNRIDLDALIRLFDTMNIKIRRCDCKTVLQHFDLNGNGTLEHNEFVQMVLGDPFSNKFDETVNSTRNVKLDPTQRFGLRSNTEEDYIDDAQRQTRRLVQKQKLLGMLRDRLNQRRVDTVQCFRLLNGSSQDSMMRPDAFRYAIKETLHLILSVEEVQTLVDIFCPGGKACTLQEFTNILQHPNEFLQTEHNDRPVNTALANTISNQPRLKAAHSPIVETVRSKILQRGGRTGFRGLTRVLRFMDDNGNRLLCKRELQSGLNTYGIYPAPAEMDQLMSYFDTDGSGSVDVTEFVRAIRGDMNAARTALVKQAFALIDINTDGNCTLYELSQLYDCKRHPQVVSGEKSDQEVYREFVKAWDKNSDDVVTLAEFIDYYTDISGGIDDDVYFELMIRNAWHLSGGEGVAANTSCRRVVVVHRDGRETVEEIKNDLGIAANQVEKMRQRLIQQGITDIVEIKVVG